MASKQASYFVEKKKGEVNELRTLLRQASKNRKKTDKLRDVDLLI